MRHWRPRAPNPGPDCGAGGRGRALPHLRAVLAARELGAGDPETAAS